jgi:hypothetical protein
MSGTGVQEETKFLSWKIQMGRRINDVSVNVEKSVFGKINGSNIFVFQVYESIDIEEKLNLWY